MWLLKILDLPSFQPTLSSHRSKNIKRNLNQQVHFLPAIRYLNQQVRSPVLQEVLDSSVERW